MCHKVKNDIPITSDQDIPCIKVMLKVYDQGDDEHFTYRPVFCHGSDFTYELGKTAVEPHPFKGIAPNTIETGLHSFCPQVDGWKAVAKWAETADPEENFDEYFDNNIKFEPVAVMCVIPKLTPYLYGESNCINAGADEVGYVSRELLPIQEIAYEVWKDFDIIGYTQRGEMERANRR